jgi:hypothetical protein
MLHEARNRAESDWHFRNYQGVVADYLSIQNYLTPSEQERLQEAYRLIGAQAPL